VPEKSDLIVVQIALEWRVVDPQAIQDAARAAEAEGLALDVVLRQRGLVDEATWGRLVRERDVRLGLKPRLGRYEVQEQIGQGAMGVVYRAWDTELSRPVAIKLLRDSARTDPTLAQRFQREARAAAGLSHANVVTVYDAGDAGGQMFIAMELVEGRPLDDFLRRERDPRAQAALIEKVARAVHHAHEQGIVHRDLKPGNVLVTRAGEPKVADFGLARPVAPGPALTESGQTLGTPAYMAPEQVLGGPVSPRTDVYALGVILYEALTGSTPHTGQTAMDYYQKAVSEEPAAPRSVNPRLDAGIETIAMKAIEKEPERRYASAAAMADDLRRWLAGEPILARPLSAFGRLWRRATKHPALLGACAAIVLAAVLGAWLVRDSMRRADRVRQVIGWAEDDERAGRPDSALAHFRAVLNVEPGHAGAAEGAARIERLIAARAEAITLLEKGRPALDGAVRCLYDPEASFEDLVRRVREGRALIENAVSKAPALALGHYLRGRSYEIEGRHVEAEACLRKSIALDPGFGPARHQLARLLLRRAYMASGGTTDAETLRNFKAAAPTVEEAARELDAATAEGSGFDDDLQRAVAAGMLALCRRQRRAVMQAARDGIARFAGRDGVEEFHFLVGVAAETEAERLKAFEEALRLRPKYALAHYARGTLRSASNDLPGALRDYDEALRLSPHDPYMHYNRGVARQASGNADGAIADYDAALAIDPEYIDARANRAYERLVKGDRDGALADAEHVVKTHPDDPRGYLHRGIMRQETGDLDGADADLTEAIRRDPSFGVAYANRANLRDHRGDPQGALADYGEAIRLEPKNALYHRNRSHTREGLGDLDGAIEDLTEAIALDARFTAAWVDRSTMRYRKKDYDGSLADAERALALNSRSHLAYRNRGLAWRSKGDRARAIADVTKALELAPADWEERERLAEVLRGLKP